MTVLWPIHACLQGAAQPMSLLSVCVTNLKKLQPGTDGDERKRYDDVDTILSLASPLAFTTASSTGQHGLHHAA